MPIGVCFTAQQNLGSVSGSTTGSAWDLLGSIRTWNYGTLRQLTFWIKTKNLGKSLAWRFRLRKLSSILTCHHWNLSNQDQKRQPLSKVSRGSIISGCNFHPTNQHLDFVQPQREAATYKNENPPQRSSSRYFFFVRCKVPLLFKNRTRDGWVGSGNDTSVLCCPAI